MIILSSCNENTATNHNPSTTESLANAAKISIKTSPQASQHPHYKQFNLDMQHYIDSYNKNYWDEVYETMYPPMHGGKSKDDVMTNFVKAKLMGMERQVNDVKIEKISDVVEDGKNLYCKIYFSSNVAVKVSGQALENKDYILTNLELSYDTQDINYDEATQTFNIPDAYTSMIAISKKGANLWKYIEIDKQKEPLLVNVIPKAVLDKLD